MNPTKSWGELRCYYYDPPPLLSEIMPSCKCFPEVSKIAPLTYNRKQDEQRYYEERYNFEHYHPLHTDMPKSEEYVKRGESTLITTTGKVYSLHHSATISYHFDKIFTPNALEMTLLSNDVKLHAYDWTFLKLSAVEHEIYNIFFHPILIPYQYLYAMHNHFADHLSKSHNLKASPFRAIGVLKGTIIEKWKWLTAAVKNECTC